MKKYIFSLLQQTTLLSIILVLNSAQTLTAQENNVLAKGKGFSISKEEFRKRFEFTPHPRNNQSFDSTKIKSDFLKTLIAEKLLVNEAVKMGLDKSPEYVSGLRYMRNLYLRDALYTSEVKNKTAIDDSEFAKGRRLIGKTLFVKYIFSFDKQEIDKIYNDLNNGASYDSILSVRSEITEQKNAKEITFGVMNEKIEDIIFQLSPGEYSKPIELEEGWYICKVYSTTIKNTIDENDLRKVERVVTERAENKRYESFYKQFYKGIVVSSDGELFRLLAALIYDYIDENEKSFIMKNGKYALHEKELELIKGKVDKEKLNLIFIKFSEEPVTLADFFEFMKYEGFDFRKHDSGYVKTRLNNYVGSYIRNELLVREALKRGYQNLPEVANDLKIWSDNYLATLASKQVYLNQDVTDDEAYAFYAKNKGVLSKPDEIKLAEIVTTSLDSVARIFNEIEKGTDFIKLAAQFSEDESMKGQNGVHEFVPVTSKGEIWETASSLKIGEVYGPIKTDKGFSIIKLIDRRDGKKELAESFVSVKDEVKSILRSEKMYKNLENLTANMAIENNIEINEKYLNSIKVNTVNMIVFRRFGFGGQQLAVPYAPEFSKWYEKYLELKKALSL